VVAENVLSGGGARARRVDPYRIAARMERLPMSPWHNKIRLIIGGIVCALFSVETAGKTLEELSPATV
jgi:hypothetical protein